MEQAILLFFEKLHTPALTFVFGALSFLGEGLTVGVVIVLLYWLIGGRVGEQLLFTATSSAAFNSALKGAVHRPRPYTQGFLKDFLAIDTPLFSTTNLGDNLSFPSGHAQATTSAITAGAFRLSAGKSRPKRALIWAGSVLLVLLVACSRLYFGVHYPTDVLTGMVLGFAVGGLWELVFRTCYKGRYYFLMGFALLALAVLPFAMSDDGVRMTGMLAGAAFFLPIVDLFRLAPPPKGLRRLLRIPVGLVSVGVLFGATYFFPDDAGFSLLKWFLLTGSATLLAQGLFKVLKI